MTLKEIKGYVTTDDNAYRANVIVRFTSDRRGETLSLSDNDHYQITVPYEKILEIVEKERRSKKCIS